LADPKLHNRLTTAVAYRYVAEKAAVSFSLFIRKEYLLEDLTMPRKIPWKTTQDHALSRGKRPAETAPQKRKVAPAVRSPEDEEERDEMAERTGRGTGSRSSTPVTAKSGKRANCNQDFFPLRNASNPNLLSDERNIEADRSFVFFSWQIRNSSNAIDFSSTWATG
jgi:hypothetical protein